MWTAVLLASASSAAAAPKAELWPKWESHQKESTVIIDHSEWDVLLGKYLDSGHPSGVSRFDYGNVQPRDRDLLSSYLDDLQKVRVSEISRPEQKAFWINLYNALTVKVILDHYPVKSIREIDISPGFFADGPWGAKLLHVEGEKISLNDIEHRILRPVWKDRRVHYSVNCASIGCPNLQPEAYTAHNTEELLEKGAREYVNHDRGVRLDAGKLTLSSIYKWFREDFGETDKDLLEHLVRYADKALGDALKQYEGKIRYEYDWNLNE